MATPTLRALRQRFPAAHITGLLRPSVAEVLAGNQWLDDLLFYHHRSPDKHCGTWNVVRRLRAQAFDLGVLLTNSMRTAFVAWAGRVKRRVGYAREGRRFLLNDALPLAWRPGGYQPAPVIDYYLALAYHLGAAPESYQLELFTTADDERRAETLWSKWGFRAEDRVVTLNPGSAFGSAKRWPARSFAELARRLADQPGLRVLILCGPNERGLARFIADASLRPRQVKSLAEEEVSIGLSKALVRRSAVLVSTDSGPRHFGAAFGIPVVSLFGPTHIEWTDTYYSKETKLQKKLPCGPCQLRVCPFGHLQCMHELTVDLVHRATLGWLEREPVRHAG